MKNTHSKITILVVSVAFIAFGIFIFWLRDTEAPKTTQPITAPQKQNQPIQPTEATQEPANSSEPAKEIVVLPETKLKQHHTSPITAQQTPQARKSIEKPKC